MFTISIHTLHTEGDETGGDLQKVQKISIHTLHTEGDDGKLYLCQREGISIHTLHTEGDEASAHFVVDKDDFNPHPPHGG